MFSKLLIASLLITLSVNICFSQNNETKYQADTSHVNDLVETAKKILFIYPDSTLIYLDSIENISKKYNYETGLYNYYNLRGIIRGLYQDSDGAINFYRKGMKYATSNNVPRRRAVLMGNIALEFWRMFNMDSAAYYLDNNISYCDRHNLSDMKIKSLFDLGNLYLDKENYIEAAKNFFKVRDELSKTNDSTLLVYLYGSIGILYTKVGNFDLAMENYRKAIDIDKYVENVNNLANSYNNIGLLYFNDNRSYDSALFYYKKSVEYALPHLKSSFELVSNINTGNIFIETKRYDSAYYYYSKVYNDTLTIYFPDRYAGILINLGVYYRYKSDYSKAREFLIKGIAKADSLSLFNYKATGLKALYEIDSAELNNELMIIHLREYYTILDSIKVSSDTQKIASLEFEKYLAEQKYNNELLLKENELNNKLIDNQKILLWVFIFAIATMLFAITILYSNRKKIKNLLNKLSEKHEELKYVNEELVTTNEILALQREELKRLNLTKDKFFSIIGHDLKSPFNVLLGLLQLMDEDWDLIDDYEKHEHIHILYNSSINTYQLLENILIWGRAQQGLLEINTEYFNVLKEVVIVRNIFDVQLIKKDIDCNINIDDDFELQTDKRYFSHIIQNLLNNAIKFTNRGGKISINATIKGNEKIVCVVDNGIGIPANKVDSIFELDSDFGRKGTENEQSTGMGLILTKEYAELIGARLTVESNEQNNIDNTSEGSSFCIIFS